MSTIPRPRGPLGRILENIAAQNRHQESLVKGPFGPGYRRPHQEQWQADRQGLGMAAIAPFRVQVAGGAIAAAGLGGATQIDKRSVVPAEQRHPR